MQGDQQAGKDSAPDGAPTPDTARPATFDPVAELDRLATLAGAPVELRLGETLRDYWLERVALHTHDSYAGIPLSKFPEDLRVYEHLLWAQCPTVVIEIGSQFGASALWFRDRLRVLAGYGRIARGQVIAIDIETDSARAQLQRADPDWERDITLVDADICDPDLPAKIARLIPGGARCFVVEDSAHVYATTTAALDGFSSFTPPGGFMMIEDGCVDVEPMRLQESWPRGVLPAVADWLARPAGADFRVRRDLELYGITCHPGGLLQRRPG